jgi:antibiotic biosynthesis monooxygenase (ABM) superfamily enzyme
MPEHPDPNVSVRVRRWQAQAVMTLAAWLVAFLAVLVLSTAFGHELGSLPLPLRALVLSGVLVALMVNLVMPVVSHAVAARLQRQPPPTIGELRQRSADPVLSATRALADAPCKR